MLSATVSFPSYNSYHFSDTADLTIVPPGTVCEICLQSWDESGPGQTWIGCDKCDRWHHLMCIPPNKRPRNFEDDTFLCRHCDDDDDTELL